MDKQSIDRLVEDDVCGEVGREGDDEESQGFLLKKRTNLAARWDPPSSLPSSQRRSLADFSISLGTNAPAASGSLAERVIWCCWMERTCCCYLFWQNDCECNYVKWKVVNCLLSIFSFKIVVAFVIISVA